MKRLCKSLVGLVAVAVIFGTAGCSEVRAEVEIVDETQARFGFTLSIDEVSVMEHFQFEEEELDDWLATTTNDIFQTDDYTLLNEVTIQDIDGLYVIDYGVDYDYSVGTDKLTFSSITVKDSVGTVEMFAKPIIDTLLSLETETTVTVEDLPKIFSSFTFTVKTPIDVVFLTHNGSAYEDRGLVMWDLNDFINLYESEQNPAVSFNFNTLTPPVDKQWWEVIVSTLESYFVNDPLIAWGATGLAFLLISSTVFLFTTRQVGDTKRKKKEEGVSVSPNDEVSDTEQDRLYAELNNDPERIEFIKVARKRQIERLKQAEEEDEVRVSTAVEGKPKRGWRKKASATEAKVEDVSPIVVLPQPFVITFEKNE